MSCHDVIILSKILILTSPVYQLPVRLRRFCSENSGSCITGQGFAIILIMELIFLVIILIFSIVLHEVSHGTMANYLGDPTAKNSGRLTLNPIPHLDFLGSFIVPLIMMTPAIFGARTFIFGWAKPVPINPHNFRDQKYGEAKVAIAGPLANFSLALVFGLSLRFLPVVLVHSGLIYLFSYIVYINIILAIFNLLPIPPLDGSHILFTFLSKKLENFKIFIYQYGIFILLFIIFFFPGQINLVANSIFHFIVGFSFF